ncbi:tRNAse Z TRZ4, mitochondrial [Amborella trichopoda]|uniref:ribonuclease Z n=1 Tax=Amborella trichopoda TaxID=13333 RepID=U5CPI8_AMBTC|nr:tRNAse Z TRZ4, mitochondrial [Amborella trichopoda]ERN15071.1 hypothetical protein AMTR_s00056p00038090 [Amborella trichopoda]|eukprot:XP_006853604.3 tRNAse Z TRZ4, mitochondrial [Amborella trichopoda]
MVSLTQAYLSASTLFRLNPHHVRLPSLSTNLRRLFYTSSSSFSLYKNTHSFLSQHSNSFPVLAAASASNRRNSGLPVRRRSSTSRDKKEGEEGQKREEMEPVFNRKRAEGNDRDKPKNLQLKTRKPNPVNTICYVQILGTGMDTQDTSPSVLLFFDKQRFIFNAGEGLQRFCTEHKIRLSKIDHMFMTRVCSETAGGLPGLLLTLAGIGEEGMTIKIWGPSDLKYLVDAMRVFITRSAVVHTHSFGPPANASETIGLYREPIVLIDDEVIKISAILLRPKSSKGDQNIGVMGSNSQEKLGYFPKAPTKEDTVSKPGDLSVVYVCELPEIKGKFDLAKAVALGLKAGPKYRELQLGNSVMSDRKDIMVHPNDVLGPSSPGPIVILVDCPTLSHVQDLVSLSSLNDYYVDSSDPSKGSKKTVNCMIHLGPSSVTKTATYQEWMARFTEAQHIMAGHEIKNIEVPILLASARFASRFNYLCPQLFPSPGFWSLNQVDYHPVDPITSSEAVPSSICKTIPAENLLKFQLRPFSQLGLDRSVVPSALTPKEAIDELLSEIPEIVEATECVRQLWRRAEKAVKPISHAPNNSVVEEPWMNENACLTTSGSENFSSRIRSNGDVEIYDSYIPRCLEHITREDLEIVLLGTGSSQPSKYRNVSAIYLNLFSKGSMLLDCGEGTLGQLKRRFGVKGADDAVKRLKCIWVSHIHADHHTGLARILALRHNLLKHEPHEPLLVIGPRQLKIFLDAYSRLEDLDMQFLDCRQTTLAMKDAHGDPLKMNVGQNSKFLETIHGQNGYFPETQNGKNDNSQFVSDDEEFMELGGITERDDKVGHVSPRKSTLFEGGKMQSFWRRPGFQGNIFVDISGIQKLKCVLCELGLDTLISVPVVHCPQAFGVVLQAANGKNSLGEMIPGWKLVYSGDTRPCQALIEASQEATVLIHEATFEDGMVEEAIARNHSTTKEAVEVGASAGAYRVVLTHFSQRYPKIPVFDETHMHSTCIGFDMMSINIADLPLLPKVVPHLKLLFKNEMVSDETEEILDLEPAVNQ